ncbi:DNA-processing protein DprA [Staphylococcus intermedius]|uniref:DprA SMF protein putative DNA processing factor n=1 Tax=Staphylococcus intermedius NCTC 11048 TaxID=1141106 RepID=A0A380G844_STAIN|nr:DNA-processing protein DprA [Staphylococcus intermedius]PCF65075.1 DNA processing protein DprA [Staphylococcus intermedius]PCF80686.1 DNA processing protein DprA [Staphylococcus intermedius]PCF82035.1 DNA processing protein DprA [Staphylococcus intermedius]PCF88371.1 DNA processing protein DprA [Staphylococcus intermedius]PCF89086.1 DNA processing protein DprA [Staphylococcus intermedius]
MKQFLLLLLYAGFSTQQIRPYYLQLCHQAGNLPQLIQSFKKLQSLTAHSHFQQKLERLETLKIHAIEALLHEHQIVPIAIDDPLYPPLLKEIYDPPLMLFCKGRLELLQHAAQSLGIVGARQHTTYTPRALEWLFNTFQHYPLTIVSGLAHGTDALAHQYAIQHQLPTIGVLGFGHFHHYPRATRPLRQTMEQHHLTMSEYPPHTPIAKFRFPERNRIISGLSKGILITEAKEKSGALITLDQALEQNRNVYVLPGDMFNAHTKGNMLRVKEGAEIVLCAQDILKDFGASNVKAL